VLCVGDEEEEGAEDEDGEGAELDEVTSASAVSIYYSLETSVVMVTLWNRADHYIFALCFLCFYLLSFLT